jgi:hypothetical protein
MMVRNRHIHETVSDKDTSKSKKIWTTEQEQLLIAWAEKASGYAWLHSKCIHYYKKRNWILSIPASIFGYLAGATTLLSNNSFDNFYIKGAIGFSAILGGIFSNFQQMFTFKELTEQHRLSTLRFLSFFRDISCELSMHPSHRTNPVDYINMKRLDLDKMLEQSPSIPNSIIEIFNMKTRYSREMHKPEVANVLQTIIPYGQREHHISKYRHTLSNDDRKRLIRYFKLWKKKHYIVKKKTLRNKSNTHIHNSSAFGSFTLQNDTINVEIANSVSHIDSNQCSDHEGDIRRANNIVLRDSTLNSESGSTFSSDELKSPSFLSRDSKLQLQNIKIKQNPIVVE